MAQLRLVQILRKCPIYEDCCYNVQLKNQFIIYFLGGACLSMISLSSKTISFMFMSLFDSTIIVIEEFIEH